MPEALTPPAGMCRLWIEGVPASQQPAPTDCANAIRNRPTNASVVFGPPLRGESRELRPFGTRGEKVLVRPGMSSNFTGRARDDARVRDDVRDRADSAVKPAPRKPEKPQ